MKSNEPAGEPAATSTQGGPWDRFFVSQITADPTFVDPPASERLKILVAMLYAYNGEKLGDSVAITGRVKGKRYYPSQDPTRRHLAMPTMEQLRAWFKGLTYRQRAEIDWRFNDRARYLELFRERARAWKPGEPPPPSEVWRNRPIEMFKDPEDVFISPRDGKLLVMGEHFINLGVGRDNSWPAVFWEQDGVDAVDGRFLAIP